jgi:hypothetical protein
MAVKYRVPVVRTRVKYTCCGKAKFFFQQNKNSNIYLKTQVFFFERTNSGPSEKLIVQGGKMV